MAVEDIAIDGVTLRVESVGHRGRPLLLVHGHPFDRSMWQPQLDAFEAAGRRAIAPDLRGYGESSSVSGKTTLDIFARDLAALLDALGLDACVICGLSMGGQIAMEFCRLFPERVAGIALAATFPRAESEGGRGERNLMADRLLREGMGLYAEEVLPKMLGAEAIAARPELAAKVLAMMRRAPPEGAAAALRGRAERPGYEESLRRLSVPALVVVGDADAFTTRADAEEMCRLLEGSELLWLERAGHMPNLERAGAFNAALERLLERVAAA